ncbi:unnamed protein product [Rotaria sordida]|uniref:Uncharacterized protein n=1 Tax=Rotaria sordida TaxID=392033 RepID=A0A819CEJ7_9BILA|nr:unnamed protein product [Rotaria sordida]CAF3811167.1 unnamed protein product [Rotaria sordida]
MGNACNTRRMIPSIPTNYSGKPWQQILYNTTIQGIGTATTGDLYLFLSDNRTHAANYLLSVTSNGTIRWKLYLDPIAQMINKAVSNIVSTNNGQVFFISSWANDSSYSAKVCRLSMIQTANPLQECVENALLYSKFNNPLAINDVAIYLFTTIGDQSPAVINTTSLELVWIDRQSIGAANDSDYNSDGTGIYWIGNDDHFRKVDGRDKKLLDENMNSGGSRHYAFDRFQAFIIRPWLNVTETTRTLVVSAWNVLPSVGFNLIWQWTDSQTNSTRCTQPVIDDHTGVTYIGVLPYLNAININGKLQWQARITSDEEIDRFNLVSNCLTLNTETKIIYTLVSSSSTDQQERLSNLFIARIRADTGTVLTRINVDVPLKSSILAQCPILIDNDMLYLAWLVSTDFDTTQLSINGYPQSSS